MHAVVPSDAETYLPACVVGLFQRGRRLGGKKGAVVLYGLSTHRNPQKTEREMQQGGKHTKKLFIFTTTAVRGTVLIRVLYPHACVMLFILYGRCVDTKDRTK